MNTTIVEKIMHNEKILSIIIRAEYQNAGIEFFTPNDFSQQLAYIHRPKGHVIDPHVHNPVSRQIEFTKEVLFIRSGKIRIDFYDDEKNYIESRIAGSGDVVLLAHGGHGIEMLEASQLIEVKQGPYAGERDKTRFQPVGKERLKVRE